MSLKGIHSVHFLGIGGIGMSALARWFTGEGYSVSGYDRTPSALTDELEKEGMTISFEDSLETIPRTVKEKTEEALIIWTPAMPADSPQLIFFQENDYRLMKRSEALGLLTKSEYTIAVAGTHGKTTTSSMIAHLLESAGLSVTAFLGGITQNFQSNFVHVKRKGKKTLFVVEADEFDRSFLRLSPSEAVLTSADADHLDIYESESIILDGFRDFIGLIGKKGHLYIQKVAMQKLGEIKGKKLKVREYGLRSDRITAENIRARKDAFVYDYFDGDKCIEGIELYIPGYHNVENSLAAISAVRAHGVSDDAIREGMKSFRGVKRRFEIHSIQPGKVYIDDYAHHPEEIKSLLSSVRAMYPEMKITAVFQPHLFSRTRDFADEFSESLSLADEVLLLDIYPAREEPIAGITSSMLLEGIEANSKALVQKDDLLDELEKMSPEVLITMGAGNIDRLVPAIKEYFTSTRPMKQL